jgi:acetolactate synthase-1/2/3 large subunit
MAAIRYFQFTEKRSVVTSGGAGTMGFGIPAAIGAKIAAPERTVCLFCGDGGFQMTMQELGTIMQENIGIKMIIMNNNFLGMVRQWQELFYNERYSSTPLVNPDFTTIASAYGIKSRLVNEREELDGAIGEMLADDKSFLLIVNVDMKELIYPMIPAGGSVTNILIN